MSLSSAWPPCTITAVASISAAASQVSCRILRDGMRTRLFADATLIRYGACTYSGMLDAFSTSASSRGLGFFQLCGLPRKNCTHVGAVGLRCGQRVVSVDMRTNEHAASLVIARMPQRAQSPGHPACASPQLDGDACGLSLVRSATKKPPANRGLSRDIDDYR